MLLVVELQPVGAKPVLIVRLYSHVELDAASIEKSIQAAADALRRSGVETAWERCATPVSPVSDPSCELRADKLVIQLRLHDRAGAKKLRPGFDQFGYAVVPQQGLGVVAGIYVDRVKRLVAEQGLNLSPVLGRLMAHEIGHLLLGPQSHSRSGIMTRRWKERELRLAVTGALHFTQPQSVEMRQQVSVRIAARLETASLAVLAAAESSATPNSRPDEYPYLLSRSGSSAQGSAAPSGPRLP